MDCDLCEEYRLKRRVVYENETAFVLVNLNLIKDGHVMVLPKRHVEKFNELTPKESKDIADLIELVSDVIYKEYGKYPIIAINPVHKRSQKHIHIHLIPTDKAAREFFALVEGTPLNETAPGPKLKAVLESLKKHL